MFKKTREFLDEGPKDHWDEKYLYIFFGVITIIAIGCGVMYLTNDDNYTKKMAYGGLLISVIGTVLSGPVANGIPHKGDIAKHPHWFATISGWSCIMIGFIISAYGTLNQ